MEHDRERAQDRLLPLLAGPQRRLGLRPLGLRGQRRREQALLARGLLLHLAGLLVEVDEDGHLRPQDQRVEGLEDVVHGPRVVALEEMRLVLVDRREEDDRRPPRLLARADQRRRLVAVHPRHEHVEQDHRELVAQQMPQRLGPRAGADHLAHAPQHLGHGEEVPVVVVHREDAGPRPRGNGGGLLRPGPRGGAGERHAGTATAVSAARPARARPIQTLSSASSRSRSTGFAM
ncbi:hypothetical protein MCELHM10_03567 [Paracoccaceae bacterium]